MKAKHIKEILHASKQNTSVANNIFFKTQKGEYAEHDKFLGISVPILRKLANRFKELNLNESQALLESTFNEERLLALFILTHKYKKGNLVEKEDIYQFYIANLKHVNNWNLVDSSAHLILGEHIFLNSDKKILLRLAESEVIWKRRIAIIATWHFIRNNQCEWTIKIAKILLKDNHDLIHKAVGWMLREAGKRDLNILKEFLNDHAQYMPRTMLRYAIEKFHADERQEYLKMKKH